MRCLFPALVVFSLACGTAAAQEPAATSVSASDLATEVQAALQGELKLWFPRCIDDENGGYHQAFNHAWEKVDQPRRTLVFQSRMLWVNATMAANLPELAEQHRAYAAHGLSYIREQFVDREHGGLFWDRMIDGSEGPMRGEKHAYALAFAIYATSTAQDVLPESGALELAIETFRWLDQHAHDAEHGGYFEAFARDGTPLLSGADSPRDNPHWDALGTAYGYKSMNTHLHLLEAFTELYRRWPDPVLKDRLAELHRLLIGPMMAETGSIHLFFTPDWRPVPGHSSYGHDVEAAYLLLESADALGMADDPATLAAARKLVDNALRYGWDKDNGGFFYEGQTFKGACIRDKQWWTQAEGLNALLLMHERFGSETPVYGRRFVQIWRFIQEHQIDHRHGGWIPTVSATGEAGPRQFKGHAWKACYHNGRAMLNVVHRLKSLPPALQQFDVPALPVNASGTTADASSSPLKIDVQPGVNPWTHLNFQEDPDAFHFAIVSDNTGRARPGVFRDAMTKLNWLRPKFVINVGDVIQGAGREEAANRQWDAFFKDLAVLEPPFFFVPGNHDISNPALRKVYNQRIGRPYYHFVYRNVLFLCVDIQDHEARRIGPEQLAYFRKVLDENRDVRWTFVFAHKPAWWMEEELSQPFEGWLEFEAMLQDRPYTFFTGHVHRYLKQTRHGREYYTLATTGGASGQRGPEMGEFDQIVWVTMTDKGPVIANIDITGILSPELRNEIDMDIADRGKNIVRAAQTLRFDGSHLDQPLEGMVRFSNNVRRPARVRMSFDLHPQFRVEPRVIECDIAPASGNYANPQPQEAEVAFRVIPLRSIAADDIVPIKLTGRIEYELADGRTATQPLEHVVHLERNWTMQLGTSQTDGRLDEWSELRFAQMPREIGGNGEAWTGPADAAVAFDLRHDDRYLYVAVRVEDDALLGGDNADRIELWLDARPMSERWIGDWQKQLFNKFTRVTLVRNAAGEVSMADAEKMPDGTHFASTTEGNTWSAEVAIPLAYIVQMQGEDWNSLRLNVVYHDADEPGERAAVLGWMPDWRWRRNIPASGTFVRVSGQQAVGSGQ